MTVAGTVALDCARWYDNGNNDVWCRPDCRDEVQLSTLAAGQKISCTGMDPFQSIVREPRPDGKVAGASVFTERVGGEDRGFERTN